MFFGSIPALVTPFAGGRVDEDTFRELVEWQIDEGSNGLVPCGTTGEAATLIDRRASPGGRDRGRGGARPGAGDRRLRVQQHRARDRADDRSPRRPAPTPPCSCRLTTTGRTRRASPPICPPSPSSDLPIIVYNVPSRTVTDISVETMAEDVEAAQCRRRQGRDRQPRPGVGPAARLRRGVRPAVGQ